MKKHFILLFLLPLLLACSEQLQNKEELLDLEWQFKQEGDSVWYPATVPGVVHTDLLHNNLIEDPYFGTNEENLQWIENENWVYKAVLQISKEQLQNHIEIEFEGLDTYAKVFLNDELILEADNMFRAWNVSIEEHIKVGANDIRIEFESPLKHNKEFVENYPYKLPSGNETADLQVSNFTRKAAYHFGWDWGPRFVTSGIWRPINLHFWDEVKLNDSFIQTDKLTENSAELSGIIEIESTKNKTVSLSLQLKDSLGKAFDTIQKMTLKKGVNKIPFAFKIHQPKLWWPNGSGEQPLYNFEVVFKDKEQIIISTSKKIGIRTVELINEKDHIGTSYYFKVNGEPMFMKGANYIPQDAFLPRVTNEKYYALFDKVIKANMNMIRVWGGGIYENDVFYDLCDEHGILVWQDFMFAGSMYPSIAGFKENIAAEAEYNIKRLRNHPSIALWCGNNEIEVAWGNWGWQKAYGYSRKDSAEIYNNYKSIFKELLPSKVKELSGQTAYISTSPTSNWGTPENFNHGSMHYWGVWHGREPFENFKTNVGRFMVEYGFQSFPEMSTIEKFSKVKDYSLDSEVMLMRQKSYIGNGLITEHMNRWFEKPKDFVDFVDKSQKTQQIGMQMAVQAHRLSAPRAMGTLFWQLNDCWPGPSWSVLDYYGNEKEAYATIIENFKHIIAVYNRRAKHITILNDSKEDFIGTVKITDGEKQVAMNAYVMANSRHVIPVEGKIKNSFFTLQLIEGSEIIFSDRVYLGNGK